MSETMNAPRADAQFLIAGQRFVYDKANAVWLHVGYEGEGAPVMTKPSVTEIAMLERISELTERLAAIPDDLEWLDRNHAWTDSEEFARDEAEWGDILTDDRPEPPEQPRAHVYFDWPEGMSLREAIRAARGNADA